MAVMKSILRGKGSFLRKYFTQKFIIQKFLYTKISRSMVTYMDQTFSISLLFICGFGIDM